jgi:hypothetical protein
MNIQAAIRSRLAAYGNLTALIGGAGARIYPEARAQEGALPAIVYSINNEEALKTLGKAVAWKADLEIVAIALTAASAQAISEQVVLALDGWTGTASSTVVMHSLHSRSVTAYNTPQAGETTGAFLQTTVFSVMYQASP